ICRIRHQEYETTASLAAGTQHGWADLWNQSRDEFRQHPRNQEPDSGSGGWIPFAADAHSKATRSRPQVAVAGLKTALHRQREPHADEHQEILVTGNPEIIAGLIKLKELTNEVHDRLHDQEHLWEALEFPKLEKKWDKGNREMWDDLHHPFLRRALQLGGRPSGVT